MSHYSIKFMREANDDISEIIAFLNKNKAGLGAEFFDLVADRINLIRSFPRIYRAKGHGIRVAPMKKFGYQIYFQTDENLQTIIVVAVLHGSRDPNIWKNRV